MSDIPIHEPNRYVRQLQDRIRDQRELLEECERVLTAVRADLVYAYDEVDENLSVIDQTLAKLRAREKVDE